MAQVRTSAVRNRLVGDARKKLKEAAGANGVLSKTEAKKLPKDVARAAETVRTTKGRVTLNDAVDAYASKVNQVLTAVDTRGKGVLSAAEANRIRDPALRASVLEVRANLQGGSSGGTTGPGVSTAAFVAALNGALSGMESFCESGDHGVNVTMRKVPGRNLDEVLAKVHLDPAAPWTHGETRVETLAGGSLADTIDAFTSAAKDALEAERDDLPDLVENFVNTVKTQFGALAEVHLAKGRDLGGSYLIGKTSSGYVAVALQRYAD
jgi:hypothetical protein